MGTSTSDISIFTLVEEKVVHMLEPSQEEHGAENLFPESREERFLAPDLRGFYKKKGYEN